MTADLDDVADDGELGEGDNARSDVETLIGGNAVDTLTGNSANNGLDGGPGGDFLNGGGGDDYALYWQRTAPVNVTLDGVVNDGEAGENDVLAADVESVVGGSGDDTLVGNSGVNNLWGFSGNDSFDGGLGADLLWGGSGVDHVSYASRTADLSVSLDNVANDGEAGEGDNLYDVDDVTGGAGADTLIGSALPNVLTGGPGRDVLTGLDGDDRLEARDEGEDDLTCGNGADTVFGDWYDIVGVECESVDRGPQPPDVEEPPAPQPEPDPEPEPDPDEEPETGAPVVRSESLRMDDSGAITLQLRCPASETGGCRGKITLRLAMGFARVKAMLSAARAARQEDQRQRARTRPLPPGAGRERVGPGEALPQRSPARAAPAPGPVQREHLHGGRERQAHRHDYRGRASRAEADPEGSPQVTASMRTTVMLRATQGIALAGITLYAAQATMAVCGQSADAFFEKYVYTFLILLAAGLCLARAAAKSTERAPWLVLGVGLLAWAGGEIYYSAVLEDMLEPPLPSGSDVLWLTFYPCCYVALVLLVRARVRQFHTSLWLDGVVGALAAAGLGCALVFGALTAGGVDPTIVAVDLTYFLGDLLLLGFVIGVLALTGWRPGRDLGLLSAGLILSALADGFFLYQAATGVVGDSTLMATLWPASALLVGCAAWVEPGQRARIQLTRLARARDAGRVRRHRSRPARGSRHRARSTTLRSASRSPRWRPWSCGCR